MPFPINNDKGVQFYQKVNVSFNNNIIYIDRENQD